MNRKNFLKTSLLVSVGSLLPIGTFNRKKFGHLKLGELELDDIWYWKFYIDNKVRSFSGEVGDNSLIFIQEINDIEGWVRTKVFDYKFQTEKVKDNNGENHLYCTPDYIVRDVISYGDITIKYIGKNPKYLKYS